MQLMQDGHMDIFVIIPFRKSHFTTLKHVESVEICFAVLILSFSSDFYYSALRSVHTTPQYGRYIDYIYRKSPQHYCISS